MYCSCVVYIGFPMESSIAEFLERQLACELLPTVSTVSIRKDVNVK